MCDLQRRALYETSGTRRVQEVARGKGRRWRRRRRRRKWFRHRFDDDVPLRSRSSSRACTFKDTLWSKQTISLRMESSIRSLARARGRLRLALNTTNVSIQRPQSFSRTARAQMDRLARRRRRRHRRLSGTTAAQTWTWTATETSPRMSLDSISANLNTSLTDRLYQSHDRHLNSDPEALFQFLLLQATSAPVFHIRILGSHIEKHVETSNRYRHGRLETHTKERDVTVVDFDFYVLVDALDEDQRGRLYVVQDDEPAWRGRGLFKRVAARPQDLEWGDPLGSRALGPCKIRKASKQAELARLRGEPPFDGKKYLFFWCR
jgi:hypothetical protein